MRGNLYLISGPSGVGKDTVVKELIEVYPNINKTVSATTRTMRSNEKDGVNYYFVSKEKFLDYQTNGELVESEIYDGEYYGTLFSEIERYPTNKPLIMVIDVRGRENVITKYPKAKSIFITPPSFEELKKRIVKRSENTPEEIDNRLAVAKSELKKADLYDFVVINDEIDICVKQIANILFSEK